MRAREVIDGLPDLVRKQVEKYRFDYTHTESMHLQAEVRTRMAGYVLGLRDAGLITERGRQIVFIYMTV